MSDPDAARGLCESARGRQQAGGSACPGMGVIAAGAGGSRMRRNISIPHCVWIRWTSANLVCGCVYANYNLLSNLDATKGRQALKVDPRAAIRMRTASSG